MHNYNYTCAEEKRKKLSLGTLGCPASSKLVTKQPASYSFFVLIIPEHQTAEKHFRECACAGNCKCARVKRKWRQLARDTVLRPQKWCKFFGTNPPAKLQCRYGKQIFPKRSLKTTCEKWREAMPAPQIKSRWQSGHTKPIWQNKEKNVDN